MGLRKTNFARLPADHNSPDLGVHFIGRTSTVPSPLCLVGDRARVKSVTLVGSTASRIRRSVFTVEVEGVEVVVGGEISAAGRVVGRALTV